MMSSQQDVRVREGETSMSAQSDERRAHDNSKGGLAIRVKSVDAVLIVLGALVTIVGIISILNLVETRNETASTRDKYEESYAAATNLLEASDFLTTQARMCVVTCDPVYMEEYLNELLVTKRRDHAVSTLRRYGKGTNAEQKLTNALAKSNELAQRELYAMHLVMMSKDITDLPEKVAKVEVSREDAALPADQQQELAEEMMLGYEYATIKATIVSNVDDCATSLVDDLKHQRSQLLAKESVLQTTLLSVLLINMALLVVAGVTNYLLIMRPMRSHAKNIMENEPLDVRGSAEVRNVAEAYNRLYSENLRRTMLLKHQAETDPLTGLLNRGSFDRLLVHRSPDIVLMMIDVDLFKQINDSYGHEIGDKVLRRVADVLVKAFRNTDYVCRVGGDEFAVILTEMQLEMRTVVSSKLEAILATLSEPIDDMPAVTLSIGVAFSATLPEGESIYHAADKALYAAKHRGRKQYVFYELD